MAGQGTGLPSVNGEAITPLVNLTDGAGSAEAADAAALGGLAHIARGVFDTVVKPRLVERAVEDARQDVLSGRAYQERFAITEVGEAYNQTLRSGTLAQLQTQDTAWLDEAAAREPFDAAAFERLTRARRSEVLHDTPGPLAMDRAAAFDRRAGQLLGNMRTAQADRDARAAGRQEVDRHDQLVLRIAQAAEGGAAFDPQGSGFAGDLAELDAIYGRLGSHPLLALSEDEIARMREEDFDRFTAAAYAGQIRRTYREHGIVAATDLLEDLLPGAGGLDLQRLEGDASQPEAPVLSESGRRLAYELGAAALAQEHGLVQQRATTAAAERRAATEAVDSLIEAMRYGAAVDHDELRRRAELTGDPGVIARASFAIEVGVQPPDGFGSSGGGSEGGGFDGDSSVAPGFDAAFATLLGHEGTAVVGDDNGAGRSRFGITERSHPTAWADGQVDEAEARRIYRSDYWDAIGADHLPPALALVAFDTAVNFGPGDARRWLDESGGDVTRLLALREAEYRRLAASDGAQYGDDLAGWLNRNQSLRSAAARLQAFQNNQEGFAIDPISFAQGGPSRPALANVNALSVDAVFDPGSQAGWSEAIRARRALGGQLAEQYQVPFRMLTDGEAAAYRDRMDRDPAAAVVFAQAATAALGGEGARDLLAELNRGDAAPALIHIADLAGPGGNPDFARRAALGLTLQAQNRVLPTNNREDINAALRRYGPVFGRQPALLAALSSTAHAAALADYTTGTLRDADYYVQRSLGRTTYGRHEYGGGVEVNGRATVAPRWLNPAYFDDALEALGEDWTRQGVGPVYSNGEAMSPGDIARLRPVLMPDGRYGLVNDRGQFAAARSGREFRLDMDEGRAFLRNRLGVEAVRPGG